MQVRSQDIADQAAVRLQALVPGVDGHEHCAPTGVGGFRLVYITNIYNHVYHRM